MESKHSSPSPLPSAGEIEKFVVDQIRHVGRDPALIRETLVKDREHVTVRTSELNTELAAINRQRHRDEAELKKVANAVDGESSLARLADLQERLRLANERSNVILAELDTLKAEHIDEADVATALTVRFSLGDSAGLALGGDIRMSASFANSSARWRARSDSPPSAVACSRHAIRFTSQTLFPVRVSSPKTSAYFDRNSLTVIR